MNDIRIKHIGLLFLSAFLLSSCSQEEPSGRGVMADDDVILFYTSLPGVQTRSGEDIDKNSVKNGFDVSAACLDSIKAPGDTIPIEYFSTQLVKLTPGMGEAFRSNGCRWPSNEGNKAGKLRFFAFFPSREVLRKHAGVSENDNDYFKLEYTKTTRDKKNVTEYWMKRFKVNKDINLHTDFVTATSLGSKTDNLYSGVNLTFQHQLSKITLMACCNSDSYDVEIAGVRIGGIPIESDFSFEGTPVNFQSWCNTKIGRWIGAGQIKGCVEYIYREGDSVMQINKESHPDSISAVSIMGNGGPALVIPYDNPIWKDYTKNPNQNQNSLYFSVLLRVKERASGKNSLLYPYIEGASITTGKNGVTTDKMNVVYLSIETSTGKVIKRLYRNKDNKKFYTDSDFKEEYSKPDTEEIRNYGWASAIPYIAQPGVTTNRWKPGVQYYYILNYTNGIGIQDPADMSPGKPIIYPVEVTETSGNGHTVDTFQDKDLDLKVLE